VIAEANVEVLADASDPGIMRLPGPSGIIKEHLRPQSLALLAFLLVLGGVAVRLSKPLQAKAAVNAAAREADGMMQMERSQLESNPVLQTVACGEVFPREVAEALCSRVALMLKGPTSKKAGKERTAPAMDTRALAAQLALYYELPHVEVVDKALRREKKKMRQTMLSLQKLADEAKEIANKAAAKAADLKEAQKSAEDAKKLADAKKGSKNGKKAADVEDSTKFANDAGKLAALKAADAEKALQAAEAARGAEDRPSLLFKMEGAWLGAVTRAWSQVAMKLGGAPTPSHMHAWAHDQPLRQSTEKMYTEVVGEKSFLE